ncbi:MAG: recombinase family protein [Oscillospiraceae bacterium]|nr:recombinase family protein [Oscillospiraceae bacterium]
MQKNEGKIAIYSRKSKFTGKGESIGNQIELCKEHVRTDLKEDIKDCVVFEDEGFSGGNLNRPAFQRMMEEVRAHKFKAIVVYRLDRISRNLNDFTGLINELSDLDVSFISIKEQFDTRIPMGRAMMYIISVFSQLERETIAERIRDNMHELAKTGRWLGGTTPTGFRSGEVNTIMLDGKNRKSYKLIPVPEEIEIPGMIFDLYTETDSLTAVEAELLRRKVKTKLGKNFTRFAIKGILQNPVYMVADEDAYNYFAERNAEVCFPKEAFDGSCGIMAYNRTEQEKGKTTRLLPVDEWIVAIGKHPGIVSSKQWIKVQESLDRNKSRSYHKPRSNEALLTGLIYCACGERMYPKLSKRRTASGEAVYTYVCKLKERSKREQCSRRNANGNVLDAAVIEEIKALTEHESSFIAQLTKSREFYTGKRQMYETQLDGLRTEFSKNEKTIDGLIDSLAVVSDSIAKPRVLKRIEELTEANREIESRIHELEGLVDANVLSDAEFELLRHMLSVFRFSIADMSVEEKRAAIRTVVRKVIWDGTNAHVVLFGASEDDVEIPDMMERIVHTSSESGEESSIELDNDDGQDEFEKENALLEETECFDLPKTHWGEGSK